MCFKISVSTLFLFFFFSSFSFCFIALLLYCSHYRESLLDPERGYKGERVEGLDFYVEHLTWKKLPKEVFEVYGGYEEAKKMREEMGFNKRVTFDASNLPKPEESAAAPAAVEPETAARKPVAVKPVQEKAVVSKEKLEQDELKILKKKAAMFQLDVEEVISLKKSDEPDELRKRFISAAVGVESNKRRRMESLIVRDAFPVEKDPIPYVIPTVSWNLFDTK